MLSPSWPLIWAGVLLMILGPTVLWSLLPGYVTSGRATGWISSAVSFGGVGFFASGWILIGSGLRPRGSMRRGALFAVVVYLLVGLAWVVAFNTSLGATVGQLVLNPGILLIALFWPLQIAQLLGLFGLQFS